MESQQQTGGDERMKGRISWRSTLMAPVCFVTRSSGGGGVKEKQAQPKTEDGRPDRAELR